MRVLTQAGQCGAGTRGRRFCPISSGGQIRGWNGRPRHINDDGMIGALRPIVHALTSSIKLFMSLLPILRFPDPRLKKVATRVEMIDDNIRRLAADMAETMYEAPGIGLAATQVDVHKRLIVIDASETRDQLLTLINPELLQYDGQQICEEGCLSVPGIYDKVERAEHVVVRYQDLDGREQTIEATGLLAVCLQHEIDHLQGRVFVEHLSQLKQLRIRNKLAKQARITA
jgi:peptide deformylase